VRARTATPLAVTALGLGCLAAVPAAAKAPAPEATASFVVTTTGAPGTVASTTARLGGKVSHVYSHALKGFAVTVPVGAEAALRALPGVAAVEPDRPMTATGTQSNPPSYGLDRIDQRNVPLSRTYTATRTGSGVTAYIIDTGVTLTHNDFGGRAVTGADYVDGGAATDCNGHGTHVAGTVGGAAYGVAKQVKLVAVRVLDCNGSGSTSGVIAGVDWVTGNHRAGAPAVANMSLGGGASTALDQAVSRSIADGVSYSVAAGNDGSTVNDVAGLSNACNGSPARVPAALTVGATDRTDTRASYSNIGSCLDIFAPGSSIVSAWYTSRTASATLSGTSMASPHVAGVAALYLQSVPSATPAKVADVIKTAGTKGIVKSPGSGSPNSLLYERL